MAQEFFHKVHTVPLHHRLASVTGPLGLHIIYSSWFPGFQILTLLELMFMFIASPRLDRIPLYVELGY